MPKNSDHIKITDTQPRVQYVADGLQTDFPFTFQIIKETDLELYLGDQKQSSNYTVFGAGDTNGGVIVLSEAPGAGSIVTLVRDTPIQRISDFQQSGMFQAKVLNDELDFLTAALQDVAENVRRSVKLPVVDRDANLDLPLNGDRANKLLGFDADGNASVVASTGNGDGGGTPGGADAQVQFNDGGDFGGASGLTYAKSTHTLSVGGSVRADAIAERTTGAGVTVEGVLVKDGLVNGRNASSDGAKLDGIAPAAIDASGVTFENLNANADVGSAANQVAPGDHRHDADYSAVDHDHDGSYAASGHSHGTTYAGFTHAQAHAPTGNDPLKLDGLAEPDDTTELNASTSKHGLLAKLSGDAGKYLDGLGNWSTPAGAAAGGDAAPGGADEEVQFNDGGDFGGASGLTYAKSTHTLSVGGSVRTDTIAEKTSGAGVTVEGLLVKGGLIDGRNVSVDGAKLDGVEAGADVTDAANVQSAGAVMNDDLSTAAMQFVIDDDSLATASDTTVATSKSVKAYVDSHALSDGDKGDISVSGAGAVVTVGNNVITNAKAADMTQYRIKGRIAAGSGDPEDLTPDQVRTIADVYSTSEVGDLKWDAGDIVNGSFADARIAETNVTQHESAIDHNALTNFVANEHIDWSSASANLSTTGTVETGDLTVTGDIALSGTVDGRDIAADGAVLDSLSSGASAYSKPATVAAMSVLSGAGHPAGAMAYVDSYAVSGDGGGGWFEARNSGETVDNGYVFAHASGGSMRWHRLLPDDGFCRVTYFGARGDGVVDETAAIQAAIDSGAGLIGFPPGTYRISASIVPAAYQTLAGLAGWEETTITGDSVMGALLSLNTDYDSTDKPRVTIDNLRFTGSADYGIWAPRNTGMHLRRLRFAFSTGNLTYDCIHAAKSWDSKIDNIRAYTEGGRAVLWLDGDMHGLNVQSVHTTAQTRYGIVVSTGQTGSGTPASLNFTDIVLQRHQVGLWLGECRSVVVNALYTESTQVPIRLGSDTTVAVSVTINAGREGILDATAQGWADNTTGVIEALYCAGVTINGFKFDLIDVDEGYNAIYLKNAKALSLINCTCKGQTGLKDLTDFITLAPDAARDNTIHIEGNGEAGDEEVRTNRYVPGAPNSISKMWMNAGVLTTEQWTPPQHLPDPTFACSLSQYLVTAPGTKQEVVRLRRSTDDDTRDFYLDSGALKRVDIDDTLATWAGSDTIYGVRWYDHRDNAAYMEQTDPARQPVLTMSGIGGKASWVFDGASGREFDIPDGWVRPYKCTAFIVAEHADAAANDEYILGSVGGGLQFSIEAGNGTDSFGWGIGTNPTTSGAAMSGNNPAILEAWVDDLTNASDKFDTSQRVNRANTVSGQTAGNSTLETTVLRLGTRDASTYFAFEGEIAEFQSFHCSLSLANRDAVSQAAMDYYSIS